MTWSAPVVLSITITYVKTEAKKIDSDEDHSVLENILIAHHNYSTIIL